MNADQENAARFLGRLTMLKKLGLSKAREVCVSASVVIGLDVLCGQMISDAIADPREGALGRRARL